MNLVDHLELGFALCDLRLRDIHRRNGKWVCVPVEVLGISQFTRSEKLWKPVEPITSMREDLRHSIESVSRGSLNVRYSAVCL